MPLRFSTFVRRITFGCLLLCLGWVLLLPVSGAELKGKVVGVADGDTLTLLVNRTRHRIRLHGIDAPETGQPYSAASKKELSRLAFGKEARVVVQGRDRYDRVLGVVWVNGKNLNLHLVQEGLAWHYVQFSKDKAYATAEADARKKRKGLWRQKKPVPPWEYRRTKGRARQTAPKSAQRIPSHPWTTPALAWA